MFEHVLITEGCLILCMAVLYIGIKKLKPFGGFLIATSVLAGLFWSAEVFVQLTEDALMGRVAYGGMLTLLYLISGFILFYSMKKSRIGISHAVQITWPEALVNFFLCGFTLHMCWADLISILGLPETRNVITGLKNLFT